MVFDYKLPQSLALGLWHSAQKTSRNMKRCFPSLIAREMQSKTPMRYHLTPVRVAVINKSTNDKCWGRCEEKRTLVHCWWEYRLVQPL